MRKAENCYGKEQFPAQLQPACARTEQKSAFFMNTPLFISLIYFMNWSILQINGSIHRPYFYDWSSFYWITFKKNVTSKKRPYFVVISAICNNFSRDLI